ncbi:hypothetical protein GMI70_06950 [Eggerthellaceae bacterium zg-893]|nr:hypothetical protein [Eggerthellaceae bacterium zg-893]
MELTKRHRALFEELGLPDGLEEYVRGLTDDEYDALESRLVDEAVIHNRKDGGSLTGKGEDIIDIVAKMAEY